MWSIAFRSLRTCTVHNDHKVESNLIIGLLREIGGHTVFFFQSNCGTFENTTVDKFTHSEANQSDNMLDSKYSAL